MPAPYVIVYQIAQRAPDWPFACIGFLPLVAGAVIIWGKRRFKWPQPHWVFAIFCCAFGVLWVCIAGTSILSEDVDAFTAYQTGAYQTLEGVVTGFRPMPWEGHQEECFSVQDQRFCYSDYVIAPGFHNATSHGGPIHEGLPVRIAYRNGRILRLEVPADQAPTQAQSKATTAAGERKWQERSENDPVEQRMTTAFLFTAMCWTLWWNVQWRRVMRFWLRPPNRTWVQTLFRVFFALNFLGAVQALVAQVRAHPLRGNDLGATVQIATVMCTVVALMSVAVLWMAERRDRKVASKLASKPPA